MQKYWATHEKHSNDQEITQDIKKNRKTKIVRKFKGRQKNASDQGTKETKQKKFFFLIRSAIINQDTKKKNRHIC